MAMARLMNRLRRRIDLKLMLDHRLGFGLDLVLGFVLA